jgi:subtilase family serine protease
MPRSPRRSRDLVRFRTGTIELLEGRALLSSTATALVGAVHHAASHHPAHVAAMSAARPAHVVSAASTHQAHAATTAHTFLLTPTSTAHPHGGSAPSSGSLTPAETRHIYGFDNLPTDLGAGQTIAIVDAYDAATIFNDADVFDKQFDTTLGGTTSYYSAYGASSTWLTKAYVNNVKPSGNAGWGQEISLDVEWAHAIAPQAKILLVEAASASYTDLLAADDLAVAQGATVVSNSWGGGESSNESTYDSHFKNATGVTFVYSAGDSGNQSYPAESPYVVSVGGTTLTHDSGYNFVSESAWSGGGGGMSAFEATPPYQSTLGLARRGNPDVSYDSNPNTGFAVYDSTGPRRQSGWLQFGGTSDAAPQWSALIAIANQERTAASKSALDGYTQTLPALYALASSNTSGTVPLYDVITGSNAVASAKPGYDLATGMGTPRRADLVIQALASV